MTSSSRSRGVQDSGWAVFAGVLFLLAGIFHLMWGIAAFASDDTFIADELLFGDLSLWGVFYIIIGTLQLAAAWLVSTARRSGQIMGLILAVLSAINAMLTFASNPLWSGDHPHPRPAGHLRTGRPRRRLRLSRPDCHPR